MVLKPTIMGASQFFLQILTDLMGQKAIKMEVLGCLKSSCGKFSALRMSISNFKSFLNWLVIISVSVPGVHFIMATFYCE